MEEKKNITIDGCVYRIEDIILKMSFLAATAHTCGTAFEDPGAFSLVKRTSILGTFYGISKQIEDMEKELDDVLKDILECNKK